MSGDVTVDQELESPVHSGSKEHRNSARRRGKGTVGDALAHGGCTLHLKLHLGASGSQGQPCSDTPGHALEQTSMGHATHGAADCSPGGSGGPVSTGGPELPSRDDSAGHRWVGELHQESAAPAHKGVWHGQRSREEKRGQQSDVAGLTTRVGVLVETLVAQWTIAIVRARTLAMREVRWWPWSTCFSYPGQVWDVTVQRYDREQASSTVPWSPDTPVSVDHAHAAPGNTLRATAIWQLLEGHPQRALLAHGALWGFSLMAQLPPQRTEHASHLRGPEQVLVDEWGDVMVSAGKAVYVEADSLPALVVSPFVVVPKEGSAGRVCHDLSAGQEFSVNGSMYTAPWEPLLLLQAGDIVARARYLFASQPTEKVVAYRLDLAAYFNQLPLRVRDAWLTATA